MKHKFAVGILALSLTIMGGVTYASDTTPPVVRANATPHSVLVELFTSEGCSDCPLADALLSKLGAKQAIPDITVIPLGEHVDYFNKKSWSDPFSLHALTLRQVQYRQVFHTDDVYTPQMIVQGRSQFVGSNAEQARRTIDISGSDDSRFVPLTLVVRALPGKKITLSVEAPGTSSSSLRTKGGIFYAITQDGLSSNVSGGENSGRKLNHTAVVRHMRRLTDYDSRVGVESVSETVTLLPEENLRDMHAVAFIQRDDNGEIVSPVQVDLKEL